MTKQADSMFYTYVMVGGALICTGGGWRLAGECLGADDAVRAVQAGQTVNVAEAEAVRFRELVTGRDVFGRKVKKAVQP